MEWIKNKHQLMTEKRDKYTEIKTDFIAFYCLAQMHYIRPLFIEGMRTLYTQNILHMSHYIIILIY